MDGLDSGCRTQPHRHSGAEFESAPYGVINQYDGRGELHAALDETEVHPNAQLTARDDLWTGYAAALALEMYLAGARDGGRVYHAFVTGELPGGAIQERKGEDQHARTDP